MSPQVYAKKLEWVWPSQPPLKTARKKRKRNKLFAWRWRKEHTEHFFGFENTDETNFCGFDGVGIAAGMIKNIKANENIAAVSMGLDKAVSCTSIDLMGSMFHSMNIFPFKPQKKIRVLSLFDGIGVGLQALKGLQFDIDAYFSSEVDKNALAVQRHNFFGEIVSLGCVTELKGPLLHAIGQIDLLMGGSPCNQLSRVNPRRKIFSPGSSGRLFFEFVRIRDYLERRAANEKMPLLWLFENTANLDLSTKLAMNQCLGCHPAKLNSQAFLPVRRERLFWSNFFDTIDSTLPSKPLGLGQLLRPYRHANVEMLPTLTTNSNSELSGVKNILPITEDGVMKHLSATEREVLLNLPRHFTDAESLSNTQRKKLLGKAWCHATITHLLSGIRHLYATKPSGPSRGIKGVIES